jgi:two-component system, response regulator PdtaR
MVPLMASPHTVLVVEDEPLLRMDIVDQLEGQGFKVFEAADAGEAIEILNDNTTIRLVFTDIDMPGSMDGLMLAAAVRDRWPPIQIIVTSGHRHVTSSDMPEGSRFFDKPYSPNAVADAMREMIA